MPVYEVRYKPWEGSLRSPELRLLAIPKYTLLGIWNKAVAISLFSGFFIPVMGYAGYLAITTSPLVREALGVRADQFGLFTPDFLLRRLVLMQMFFATIIAIVAAPRMISNELANRALPLIYSRPITRSGYILGKFMSIALLLSLATWVQALAIWVLMYSFLPPEHVFHVKMMRDSIPQLLATMMLGILMTCSLGLVSLALSGATKSARDAAIFFFVTLMGTSLFTNFIERISSRDFVNVGLREIFYHLSGRWLSSTPTASDQYSLFSLLGALVVWCGLAFGFLLWKLRPVDVHGD